MLVRLLGSIMAMVTAALVVLDGTRAIADRLVSLTEVGAVWPAGARLAMPHVFDDVIAAVAASPLSGHLEFLAHGMGLVQHEAPWLTAHGPIPYAAHDAERELEAGMVLSVETTLLHPARGFIKLEDTIVVTETGYEPLGDAGRGWNRTGRQN